VLNRLLSRLARSLAPHINYHRHRAALHGLELGDGSTIGQDPEVYSPERIHIGKGVRIGRRIRLQAITGHNQQSFTSSITIGDGTSIENNCTLTANHSITLGRNVMVAGNVFISDHEHQYQDPNQPIQAQDLTTNGKVTIGDGTHLGQNVCIFGNVTIGEHCVIGANSVVTKDIPAFSVAAGSPARVVRRYDAKEKEWIRVA
jgi:acetyltransferase-like isoleucine patch superfamily enzyme